MENLLNLSETTRFFEILGYFSAEILCIFAIILNLFFFLFFKRKLNIKRISDFITFGTFSLNTLILGFLYFRNASQFEDFNLSFFDGLIVYDNNSLFYKLIIHVFFVLFVLSTYKITRKARFKTPLINSILLIMAPFATLLLQVQNYFLAFILLEICLLFVYKYASVARIRNFEIFCPDFVLMSTTATVLFFAFCALAYFIKSPLQLYIIHTCIILSILLKAGLFPVYNYTLNKGYKNNIAYSILLFCLVPFLGINVLIKFIGVIDATNEICIVSCLIFAVFLILTCAINAFRTKNLAKYVANISCVYFGGFIVLMFVAQNTDIVIKYSLNYILTVLSILSLLCVLKKNLKSQKLNFAILRGLFVKNRVFCALFSLCILILCNVVPTGFLIQNMQILKAIYVYDLMGSCIVFALILSNVLIMLNGLSAIKLCYTKPISAPVQLIKRTTLNYVVPCLIIFILILKIFI